MTLELTSWLMLELVFAATNTAAMYLFVQAFVKEKRDIHILCKIFVFFLMLAGRFSANYFGVDNMLIISGASIILTIMTGLIFFRAKIFWIVLTTFFFLLAAASTELASVHLIIFLKQVRVEDFMQFSVNRALVQAVSYLLLIILIILIRWFRVGQMGPVTVKTSLVLCLLPVTSIFIVYQFIVYVISNAYSPNASGVVALGSIIFANTAIFLLTENLIRQNEKDRMVILLESQNSAQQSHILKLTEWQEEIRKISHDFKQHIEIIGTLCRVKKYDKLLLYIDNLSDSRPLPAFVKTGNVLLDAILSVKISDAKKENIDFTLRTDMKKGAYDITIEICVLLGNGLDNAIEACMRSSENEKIIVMDITIDSSQFECFIKNTLGTPPQHEGAFFKTSKIDSAYHGIGLRSMKQTCDALGGIMECRYDDRYFECLIYLPVHGLK